jgi:hypothetical protein
LSEHLEQGRHEPGEHRSGADVDEQQATAPRGLPDGPADPTGHPVADEVLAAVDSLGERPVGEHVAVFEAAHEKLRAALTDVEDRPDGPSSGN